MNKEFAPIHKPEHQMDVVRKSISLEGYLSFDRRYFDRSAEFAEIAVSELNSMEDFYWNPEYFKYLTLVSSLVAEYGFSGQDGGIYESELRRKHSPFSPKHQLALASYMGKLNEQAFPIRSEWENEIAKSNPDVAKGVWGIHHYVKNGQIVGMDRKGYHPGVYDHAARRMARADKPIAMPNRELNNAFANLDFSRNDAKNMSDEEFNDVVLPEARHILKGIVDTRLVFENGKSFLAVSTYCGAK